MKFSWRASNASNHSSQVMCLSGGPSREVEAEHAHMAVVFAALDRSGRGVACFGPLADHIVIAGDEAATVALGVLVGLVDHLGVLDRLTLDDALLGFLVSHLYLLGSPARDPRVPCSGGWYSSHF